MSSSFRGAPRLAAALVLVFAACGPAEPADTDAGAIARNDAGVVDAGPVDAGEPTCADLCPGCCAADGRCLGGRSNSACGSHGASCLDCTDQGGCGTDGACVGLPPEGDTCTSPRVIALTDGAATVDGTTVEHADDFQGSCSPANTPDMVFALTVPANGTTVSIFATPAARTKLYVSVLGACDAVRSSVGCFGSASLGAGTGLEGKLDQGTYYVWVESATATAFELDVQALAPIEADSCDPATYLFTNGLTASVDGTTRDAKDDVQGTCGTTGPDVAYAFYASEPSRFEAAVTSHSTGFAPRVWIKSESCDWGTDECGATVSEGKRWDLPRGSYWLVVESPDGTEGDFHVDATLRAFDGRSCELPIPLTVTDDGAEIQLSQPSAADDDVVTCTAGAPDRVYSFSMTQAFDYELMRLASDQRVALVAGNCGALPTCSPSGVARTSGTNLPAGRYFLFVEGVTTETWLGPPVLRAWKHVAGGGTCLEPSPITFTPQGADRVGRVTLAATSRAGAVLSNACGLYSPSATRVYSFETTVAVNFLATAPVRGYYGGDPSLLLTREDEGCVTSSGSPSCGAKVGDLMTLSVPALAPGRYLLTVATGYDEATNVDVKLVAPTPGDVCEGAPVLTFPDGVGTQTLTSNFTGVFHEYASFCSTEGPDRAWTIVTTKPRSNVVARVTPRNAPTMEPVVGLYEHCSRYDAAACDSAWNPGGFAIASASNLPPGQWDVWVDAKVPGDFDLAVTVTETRDGESCEAPVTLPLSGALPSTATTRDDTSTRVDDAGACSSVSRTPDAAFAITTDRPGNVRVKVVADDATAEPTIFRQETCESTFDSQCSIEAPTGTAGLRIGKAAVGTHLVSVDLAKKPGPFALTATLEEPAQGDDCTNPIPLAFTNGTFTRDEDLTRFFCSGENCTSGTDAFFAFTTDRTVSLELGVSALGQYDSLPELKVWRQGCQSLVSTEKSAGGLRKGALPAGSYVLGLSYGLFSREGRVRLTGSVTTPTPGVTCAIPAELAVPTNGGEVAIDGDLTGAFDENDSCGNYGPETYWRFTLTKPMSVLATVTAPPPAGSTSTTTPRLSIESASCASTVTCSAEKGDTSAFLKERMLPAGSYALRLETGSFGRIGAFHLAVTFAETLPGDTCAAAIPVTIPAGGGHATLPGNTRLRFDDLRLGCSIQNTPSTPDEVYAVTIPSAMTLTAEVSAKDTSFHPVVAIRRSCGGTGDLQCATGGYYARWARAVAPALAAGTYFVWVEGEFETDVGEYVLNLHAGPGPSNGETCTDAAAITLPGGQTGSVSLPLLLGTARSDEFVSCASDASGGGDREFKITTTAPRRLHARVTDPTGDLLPALEVQAPSACDVSTTSLACDVAEGSSPAKTSVTLPAGTSRLVVKATHAGATGDATLDVSVDDFPPGEVCSGAIPLTLSNGAAGGTAHVTGDLAAFFPDDLALTCAAYPGKTDVFYTFTTNRTLNLRASFGRAAEYAYLTLGLLSGCGTELACRDSLFRSDPVTIEKAALPAGTYTLVLHGTDSAPGGFTLDVSLQP